MLFRVNSMYFSCVCVCVCVCRMLSFNLMYDATAHHTWARLLKAAGTALPLKKNVTLLELHIMISARQIAVQIYEENLNLLFHIQTAAMQDFLAKMSQTHPKWRLHQE